MDRQQILDNFIAATEGKGPCHDAEDSCQYIHPNHPGCAIGCQPGFKEKFGKEKWVIDNCGIEGVLDGTESEEVQTAVEEFFDIVPRNFDDYDYDYGDAYGDGDGNFLVSLQELHDDSDWNGQICSHSLERFCEVWKLKIPQISS